MKRLVSLLLILTLLVSLAACGKDTNPDKKNPQQSETVEQSFQEMVAMDTEACAITITKINADHPLGYTLLAKLENKSADKTYVYVVENASFNGILVNPQFHLEVAQGKSVDTEINFPTQLLEKHQVAPYTDIELTFEVYDADRWESGSFAKETVHIYPYGKDKAEIFVRKDVASDQIIINNEYVRVTVTGYEKDEDRGYLVHLFLQNKSKVHVVFMLADAALNGIMVDPEFAAPIDAGKSAFSYMLWPNELLKKKGISKIKKIEFEMSAFNTEDWNADDLARKEITLTP